MQINYKFGRYLLKYLINLKMLHSVSLCVSHRKRSNVVQFKWYDSRYFGLKLFGKKSQEIQSINSSTL